MIEFLNDIDSQLFLALNSIHAPAFDGFMVAYSYRWTWVPFYILLSMWLYARLGWKMALGCVIAIIIGVTIADQTCATFIRPYVERLRPSNLDNPLSAFVHIVNGRRGGSYGFPSCHAANSMALATYLILLARKTPIASIVLIWAFLNGYTRLYLGLHYPGDLLAGAVVGILAGSLCYYVSRPLLRLPKIVGNAFSEPVTGGFVLTCAVMLVWSLVSA